MPPFECVCKPINRINHICHSGLHDVIHIYHNAGKIHYTVDYHTY